MVDVYSVVNGAFGRLEVVQYSHDLVMHAHSETHFAFWLYGGDAYVNVGNNQFKCARNLVLGINSLASHDLKLVDAYSPAFFLMLYLEDRWLDETFKHFGRPVVLPSVEFSIIEDIQDASWKLSRCLLTGNKPSPCELDSQVKWLIDNTVEQAMKMHPLQLVPVRRKMVDYRLRVAMAHMRENIDNPTAAEKVADVVGLSRSRFFELFNTQLDTSPHVYWNSVRLEEAVKRLRFSDENMTTLAMDLGFSTPGNFSRFFREHIGVTPSTYRRLSYAA